MTLSEFQHLRILWHTSRRHKVYIQHKYSSKRSVKGLAKGVGCSYLKNGRITSEVGLETVFVQHNK